MPKIYNYEAVVIGSGPGGGRLQLSELIRLLQICGLRRAWQTCRDGSKASLTKKNTPH
jgi:hypothetical protein